MQSRCSIDVVTILFWSRWCNSDANEMKLDANYMNLDATKMQDRCNLDASKIIIDALYRVSQKKGG